VNGVLRALDRERERIGFPDAEKEPVEYLCSWGSHPRWLVERWLSRWGFEETARLVAADNERPELYVRPIGIETEAAAEQLREAGVEVESVDLAPRALRVTSGTDVRSLLRTAPLIVQDPAAGLVTDYAAVPEGATVLDLCAAPGGKAAGASVAAGYVVAGDVSEGRIRRVRQNIERLGLQGRVGAVVADARQPPYAGADLVLLDAPCTGTGTFRRHPDGRWRVGPEELAALVALQRELLASAARLVRPGGILVYATCSLEPEENEGQMEAFLASHGEFEPAPVAEAVDATLLAPDGSLRVQPQRHGVDGAYALRLRRTP
jgi:16S rRNA (cytosine967-C5)-methyltransferase